MTIAVIGIGFGVLPARSAAVAAAPDVPTATRDVYLVMLERFKANVAAGIRAVIDGDARSAAIRPASMPSIESTSA